MGIVFLFIGNTLGALIVITEERLLSKYYCHPFEIVGIEGASGLGIALACLCLLQVISCTPSESFCRYGRIEDTVK